MAVSGNYYLNGPSLSTATAIFTDVNLTICAPDGWYSDGVISRELVGCKLLTQQTCSGCNENQVTLQFNANSAADLFCAGSSTSIVYMVVGDIFSTTTQIYQDSLLTIPAIDGFYREPFNSSYREQQSSTLGSLTTGPTCSGGFFISGLSSSCNSFCTTNYLISVSKSSVSGNDYSTLTIGDEIVGGLVDGYYAYAATSTNTSTGTFKVMEILSNQIVDISLCVNGQCQSQ